MARTAPQTGLAYLKALGPPCWHQRACGVGAQSILRHGPRFRWERVRLLRSLQDGPSDPLMTLCPAFKRATTRNHGRVHLPWKGWMDPSDPETSLCFNFRTDRCREITMALTQQAFPEHMEPLALHYVTMTNHDDSFEGVSVMYDKPNLENTLGEVVASAGNQRGWQKRKIPASRSSSVAATRARSKSNGPWRQAPRWRHAT